MRPTLFIATRGQGYEIARLIKADQVPGLEALDWTDLGGQWLVAAYDGRLVGCLQLLAGKPFGRAEHLGLDESLGPAARARVVSMLLRKAFMLLRQAGCGAIIALVPDEFEGYQRALSRRGAVAVSQGTMLIKRLV